MTKSSILNELLKIYSFTDYAKCSVSGNSLLFRLNETLFVELEGCSPSHHNGVSQVLVHIHHKTRGIITTKLYHFNQLFSSPDRECVAFLNDQNELVWNTNVSTELVDGWIRQLETFLRFYR